MSVAIYYFQCTFLSVHEKDFTCWCHVKKHIVAIKQKWWRCCLVNCLDCVRTNIIPDTRFLEVTFIVNYTFCLNLNLSRHLSSRHQFPPFSSSYYSQAHIGALCLAKSHSWQRAKQEAQVCTALFQAFLSLVTDRTNIQYSE